MAFVATIAIFAQPLVGQQGWGIATDWSNGAHHDIAFTCTGPNFAAWKAELVNAPFGLNGVQIFLEQDVGTFNGGGNGAGEYKLSDAGRQSWPQTTDLYSLINDAGGNMRANNGPRRF